jgi:HSP20 family protein
MIMTIRDMIPWSRGAAQPPSVRAEADWSPFLSLHREMNRLFDDVFRGVDSRFPGLATGAGSSRWPSVEASETDKEIRVTAEVPGMSEKDIEVTLNDGVLTLRGEKRSETEDKDRHFSEHFYGRFERHIAVGFDVQEDKIDAAFKNGVLTVTMPKSEKAQSKVKRIAVRS